jgi:acetyl esterase
MIVVSPEYRLAPEHVFPAGLNDCFEGLLWCSARDHPLISSCSSSTLFVGGDSAGGNFAAVLSLLARDGLKPDLTQGSRVELDATVLIYPWMHVRSHSFSSFLSVSLFSCLFRLPSLSLSFSPFSQAVYFCSHLQEPHMPSHVTHSNGYILSKSKLNFFSALYLSQHPDWQSDFRVRPLCARSLENLPPTIIVTASLDPLCDEGVAYSKALARAGVAVEHHAVHSCHGFVTALVPERSRAVAAIVASLVRFAEFAPLPPQVESGAAGKEGVAVEEDVASGMASEGGTVGEEESWSFVSEDRDPDDSDP